jgi:hypothetical protein
VSNELTINITAAYSDADGVADEFNAANFIKSLSTKLLHRLKQSVTTSPVALNLGGISSPGYVGLKNLDPTNYVSVLDASNGSERVRLDPNGGPALLKLGSAMLAPYLQANTATCLVEIIVFSN